jgi:hypothetical protein
MNRLNRRRIRRGTAATLTGAFTLLALGTIAPLTAQAAISCTAAQTIRGDHPGAITVAGNQKLCLKGAQQHGAITVNANGQLSVSENSTVEGAVTLNSNYRAFEFCASKTVGGAISATGGQTTPVIGNGGSCGANTVDGAVTLNANKLGIMLAKNKLLAAVTASGNSQGGFLGFGAGPMRISGNAISGALTCTGNNPDPTNNGVSNTVGGLRTGESCVRTTF